MKNIPGKIYLNLGGAEDPEDFNELVEVTWCSDKIDDKDIEYVLYEKEEPLTDQEIESFLNHPGVNTIWFIKRAFVDSRDPARVKRAAISNIYHKLNKNEGMSFSKEEYDKLREAIKEFSSFPL